MNRTLLLAVGNEIRGDDSLPFHILEDLKMADGWDIVKTSEAGLALMDVLVCYEKVVVLDTVRDLSKPDGDVSVMTYRSCDAQIQSHSNHVLGLSSVLALASQAGLKVPDVTHFILVNVRKNDHYGTDLSPGLTDCFGAVTELIEKYS